MSIKPPIFIEILTKSQELWPGLQEQFRSGEILEFAGKSFAILSANRDELSVRGVLQEVTLTKRGDDLPSLESTVRIVPGNTVIWDVAEQFVGVDCRLKAVFMLGDTRMVAVENIGSGQCCCFWASMVRTPEQAKSEEREAGIENLLDWVAAQTKVDRSEFYKKNWAVLYDAGLRPPVNS